MPQVRGFSIVQHDTLHPWINVEREVKMPNTVKNLMGNHSRQFHVRSYVPICQGVCGNRVLSAVFSILNFENK